MAADDLNTHFTIQVAQEADLAALESLVNGAYRGDGARRGWTTEADFLDGQRTDQAALKEILTSADKAILCLVDRRTLEILGCVCVELKTGEKETKAHVGMLTVNPRLQNQGLGKWLLQAAEDHAREAGARWASMSVIQIRHSLIAWYEKQGYQPSGSTAPFPYGEARFGIPRRDDLYFVLLEKQLPL